MAEKTGDAGAHQRKLVLVGQLDVLGQVGALIMATADKIVEIDPGDWAEMGRLLLAEHQALLKWGTAKAVEAQGELKAIEAAEMGAPVGRA